MIRLYREALLCLDSLCTGVSNYHYSLAVALVLKFHISRKIRHLDEAIASFQQCLSLRPKPESERFHPVRLLCACKIIRHISLRQELLTPDVLELYNEFMAQEQEAFQLATLGNDLLQQFTCMGDVSGLEEAISLLRSAVKLHPSLHHRRTSLIDKLACALAFLFDQTDDLKSLDEAILLHRQNIDLQTSERGATLNNLGLALSHRFHKLHEMKDLQESIDLHSKVLLLRPLGHPNRAGTLSNLAIALMAQFDHAGDVTALHSAVDHCREALAIIQKDQAESVDIVSNLGNAHIKKFTLWRDPADLDLAIKYHQEALSLYSPSHPNRCSAVYNCASTLTTKFEFSGHVEDLDAAMLLYQEALTVFSPSHPGRFDALQNICNLTAKRFQLTGQSVSRAALDALHKVLEGDLDNNIRLGECALEIVDPIAIGSLYDLESALTIFRRIAEIITDCDPLHAVILSDLARLLLEHFKLTGQTNSLEESFTVSQTVLSLHPLGDPDHGKALNDLAIVMQYHFEQYGRLEDLDHCIKMHRRALDQFPASHRFRHIELCQLADVLCTHYEVTGSEEDLNEAINYYDEAIELGPEQTTEVDLMIQHNFSVALVSRFDSTGDLELLEKAVAMLHKLMESISTNHIARPLFSGSLANALHSKYLRTGHFEDLQMSTSLNREALEATPAPHFHRPGLLNALAGELTRVFDHTRDPDNLNEAISLHEECLNIAPMTHHKRAAFLNGFAITLLHRFGETGEFDDLERAVLLNRQAVSLFGPCHREKAASCRQLGTALRVRFREKRLLVDLNEAISIYREAIGLMDISSPDYPSVLNDLAIVLSTSFDAYHTTDLNEAITLYRKAYDLFPETDPKKARVLDNLATVLATRFEQSHDSNDLEQAIDYHRKALLAPMPATQKFGCLNNLANSFSVKFDLSHLLDDGHAAVQTYRDALSMLPDFHPNRAISRNLAFVLVKLHAVTGPGSSHYLDEAVDAFRTAVNNEASSIIDRFYAARSWAWHAYSEPECNHPSALEAYAHSIGFIPRLAALDMNLEARQAALSGCDGHACEAAKCAIRAGELTKAVEFLEAGRAVFWSQALRLRTPIDDLYKRHPHLARKLHSVSRALETESLRSTRKPDDNPELIWSAEQQAARSRKLTKDWHTILDEIRTLDGFDGFMLPKSFSSLQETVAGRQTIILNASRLTDSCDALAITSCGVEHIPLPITFRSVASLVKLLQVALSSSPIPDDLKISLQSLRQGTTRYAVRVGDFGQNEDDYVRFILEKLWSFVVLPIVQSLKMEVSLVFIRLLSLSRRKNRNPLLHLACGGVPQVHLPSSPFMLLESTPRPVIVQSVYPIT